MANAFKQQHFNMSPKVHVRTSVWFGDPLPNVYFVCVYNTCTKLLLVVSLVCVANVSVCVYMYVRCTFCLATLYQCSLCVYRMCHIRLWRKSSGDLSLLLMMRYVCVCVCVCPL